MKTIHYHIDRSHDIFRDLLVITALKKIFIFFFPLKV